MRDIDLTVCICVYNGEKYIAGTLESLYRQTFRKFRLLIVDDCSTDHTIETAQAYIDASGWAETEILSLPENRGTAYVRNLALHRVGTPLLMFFDADDIAKPEMIERLYEKLTSDENLIAVSCFCSYMDAEGNPLSGGLFLGPQNVEEFRRKAKEGKMIFFTPPTLFKKEYAQKAGGYRQADWFPTGPIRYEDFSEDVDLWGRMSDFFAEGKIMVTLPKVLFLYRKNTNSLSTGFAKARVMGQKLLYIKNNQLRRRAGLQEMKFEEYWTSLSLWAKLRFERRNLGAGCYRSACFAWVQHRFFRCVFYLGAAGVLSPFYPLEKFKANFRKKEA